MPWPVAFDARAETPEEAAANFAILVEDYDPQFRDIEITDEMEASWIRSIQRKNQVIDREGEEWKDAD